MEIRRSLVTKDRRARSLRPCAHRSPSTLPSWDPDSLGSPSSWPTGYFLLTAKCCWWLEFRAGLAFNEVLPCPRSLIRSHWRSLALSWSSNFLIPSISYSPFITRVLSISIFRSSNPTPVHTLVIQVRYFYGNTWIHLNTCFGIRDSQWRFLDFSNSTKNMYSL